jgi:Protein of unknown function (DUF2934)
MKFAPALEDTIRRRAYELYEKRCGASGNAIDDWLQAEAEVVSHLEEAASRRGAERKWRNIEPLLRWGAVAYALGFVTVLVHTWRLGIPAIRLIEPINIWVGFPLALVLFFLDKIISFLKRAEKELKTELEKAREQRDKVHQTADPKQLYEAVIEGSAETWALLLGSVFPFGGYLEPSVKRLFVRLGHKLEYKPRSAEVAQKRAAALRWFGTLIFVERGMLAAQRFATAAVLVGLIPVACLAYVSVVYPMLPQSIGFGKPVTVQLIMNTDRIPRDAEIVRDMFPTEASAKPRVGKEDKANVTMPVTLYYQTEHAYYVSKGTAPIVSLNRDAVDGIIFLKGR